jgi:hypothetical protein
VIALRHVQFEDLGLLANILHQAGWAVSYREAPIDDLSDRTIEDADLLVVLGGPIGVYEIDTYSLSLKRDQSVGATIGEESTDTWDLSRRPTYGEGPWVSHICRTDQGNRMGTRGTHRRGPSILPCPIGQRGRKGSPLAS